MGTIVNCNRCKKDFEIRKLYKNYFMMDGEKITEIYFQCYLCDEKFISGYENQFTLSLQKKIERGKLPPSCKKNPFEYLQIKVKKYLKKQGLNP